MHFDSPAYPSSAHDSKSFHLKWSSHGDNMETVFATLFDSEGLTDVSIVCEGRDGEEQQREVVRAHRLLLSASSNYFMRLFLDVASTKRPTVVLPGISASTLRQLITFIYTGEVQVTEEFLEPLLEAAEMLQVRGLTEQNGDNSSGGGGGGSRRRSNESSVSGDNSAKKRMRMSEEEHNEQSQPLDYRHSPPSSSSLARNLTLNIAAIPELFLHPTPTMTTSPMPPPISRSPSEMSIPEEPLAEEEEEEEATEAEQQEMMASAEEQSRTPSPIPDISSSAILYHQQQQEIQQEIQEVLQQQQQRRDGSSYNIPPTPIPPYVISPNSMVEDITKIMAQVSLPTCPLCQKDCISLTNLRAHLHTHVTGKPFACDFCPSKFARASHLSRHRRTHTGEKPFECSRCGKLFSRQDKLKTHVDRHLVKEGVLPPSAMPSKPKKSYKKKKKLTEEVLQQHQPVEAVANYQTDAAAQEAAVASAAAAAAARASWNNCAFPGFSSPFVHQQQGHFLTPPASAPAPSASPPTQMFSVHHASQIGPGGHDVFNSHQDNRNAALMASLVKMAVVSGGSGSPDYSSPQQVMHK